MQAQGGGRGLQEPAHGARSAAFRTFCNVLSQPENPFVRNFFGRKRLNDEPEPSVGGMTMRRSHFPVIALGAIGIVLAAYAYFSSDSGVAGTLGALLALLGAAAVTVGSVIAAFTLFGGGLFGLLAFLIGLAAVLTALAGFFLMQYGLAAVMALAFVGLMVAVFRPARHRRPI
jgi:hypothetical protein